MKRENRKKDLLNYSAKIENLREKIYELDAFRIDYFKLEAQHTEQSAALAASTRRADEAVAKATALEREVALLSNERQRMLAESTEFNALNVHVARVEKECLQLGQSNRQKEFVIEQLMTQLMHAKNSQNTKEEEELHEAAAVEAAVEAEAKDLDLLYKENRILQENLKQRDETIQKLIFEFNNEAASLSNKEFEK